MNPKLAKIYNQIPIAICPEGCGMCCGPVFPSLAELRNIQKWCIEHHMEYKNFLAITDNGLCPYLSIDKKCLIYPVRPFLCRILGASTELPCPLNKCKANKLLNRPQSDSIYAAIYLHGKDKPRTEKHRQIINEVFRQLSCDVTREC